VAATDATVGDPVAKRGAAGAVAGVEPEFDHFQGSAEAAWALVRSLNDHRRQMTPSKWALVAARQ
jgi:hypothetical protein